MNSIRMTGALLLGIALGFAIFGGLQYYFKADFWVAALLAALGGLYSSAVPLLEMTKKFYEIRKLRYEVNKLQKEDRIVQLPTQAEVMKIVLEKKQILRTESIFTDVKMD